MSSRKVQGSVAASAAVVALLGWVLGSALQLQQPSLWPTPVYAGLVLMGLAGAAWGGLRPRPQPPGLALAWAALFATLLGFASVGLRAQAFDAQRLAPELEGQDLRLVGTVAAMPQRSELGWRFRFDVDQAWQGTQAVAVPERIDLGWYLRGGLGPAVAPLAEPSLPALRAGERWQFTVRLKAPHGQVNPHGFDVELWWWEQGIQATGAVRDGPKDPAPQRLGDGGGHPLERARQSVRDAIVRTVAEPRLAGVVAALVTGDQNAIARADWDIYRATGVAHLMSISGLHITMFAWGAAWAVGGLWRRSARLCLAWPAPRAALLGGLLLAWAYALFSGWGVPAQRTVAMLATAGLLRLAGARWPWPVVALLAMAVVVTADPWALLQAGFWLSFVAVAVLFASDTGADRLATASWRGRLVALWREQWVVTLALTPLSVLLFGQVSVVGLLANLVAIPWVTGVVTPLALLGVLWAPLWQLAAGAVEWLGLGLQALASLPWASWSRPAPALWAALLGVAGGLLLALRWPWPVRLLGLPLVLPVLLWQQPRPAPGEFELLAPDIGQGNAVLVRTARHSLLYDAGPRYAVDSDAGHRVLVPLLRALDERLDLLVLSHRDLDHTGGAPAVLAMQPQAGLLSSIEAAHPLQTLRPARRCLAGQRWDWDGVQLAVLHPQPGDEERGSKSNALSCVLRIDNGRRSALLVGDIEAPQEAGLLAQGAPLQATLLLVPHHGSKTSSSAAFVAAVRPHWALVQAGYRNRFGHPAPEVVDRYRAQGVALLDSAHCGALAWSSQGQEAPRCERQAAPRYWRHHPPE